MIPARSLRTLTLAFTLAAMTPPLLAGPRATSWPSAARVPPTAWTTAPAKGAPPACRRA